MTKEDTASTADERAKQAVDSVDLYTYSAYRWQMTPDASPGRPPQVIDDLVNRGELARKRIGKSTVYWLPGQTDTGESRAGLESQT